LNIRSLKRDKYKGYQRLGTGNFFYTRREPLAFGAGIGVNFTLSKSPVENLAPALAAGKRDYFKPSERTAL